ncbi:FAD-dependent oxidoreductase [Rhizobium leguminosarum]|uniref:FAD-dependent oxidoreductase n=1 Tax=Rhizobium leguminosarum TaxID=384 RepID=A0A444I9C9_RHILE|nr:MULTISPECIES: FAD-dependent oxidoreductase [Rhizobium]RWX18937.1 FAD-dependent oxidoreductase [Rhizobium leguminosarum]RWX35508.1 FAD-dependent oxidoreductase [Rhizobium leguminosarum]TBC96707.1 FAD-dependent oxidoreductase [Rhizobium leguminosarum]TBD07092.1 FAD-dependent oxidoreductase [Rhizobium leguminosarum]WSG89054.1 FAD-dependent oxidoreductase [Rhizobium beringeri]
MTKELPKTAKAVVIGGGIIGCSTAYHLGKLGWTDTVLLERKKLTSGTTFHAAGLVGQLRTSANITQLLGYSVDLYKRLEEETGLGTGWKMNGGLRLACNEERWTEVRRQATTAQSFGLEMQLLTPQEAFDLWPLMTVNDLVGAAFLPTDGQANPSDITQALAKGARMSGVSIFEDTEVLDLEIDKGKIRAVITAQGRIECERVVVCAGQWTRAFAARFGVNVPLVSVEHQYIITESFGVPSNLPTLRDPDRLTYYKEEVGGIVMGGYEPNPIPWAKSGIPEGFHYTLLDSNFDHFEQIMEQALGRVPALENVGVKQLLNGPESFTPDGNFILGEAPELKNFFVGAGFNAFGIASAGGAGMALAEWVTKGEPPYDLWPVDIRRFGRPHFDTDWVRTRTLEAYGKHYTMAWPFEEHSSGRPCRKSPLYDRLKAQGACFGEKLGWERPNWFADLFANEEPKDVYSYTRQNWFDAVGREHKAVREAAVIFDQTSFAKFALKGRDAEAALSWIASNDVARPVGSLIYTQMLNDKGGIECDVTVARIAENEYYIVTGTGFATHDFDWIARNIPAAMHAELVDVTSAYSVLSLMGPNSRAVLEKVTGSDVSNAAFPFGKVRTIGIAGCPVRALRITYVGELGYELHVPIEYATTVYDVLMASGGELGLVNAGYRAIESCRLEKGYRAWGSDIGPDHTPVEAGLGWAVKMRKNIPFRGREAIERQLAGGVKKRLACFIPEDADAVLLGRETIYRDGKRVGWLSSGGFGYTLGKPIGYGYIRNPDGVTEDFVLSGTYELDVARERISCKVSLSPLYDPDMARIKA